MAALHGQPEVQSNGLHSHGAPDDLLTSRILAEDTITYLCLLVSANQIPGWKGRSLEIGEEREQRLTRECGSVERRTSTSQGRLIARARDL
ncbi:MAG: hypothetical protein LZF62_480292 [Nitrospira sp.]|nr:MAG: hypothetical protein LZF62_480292 [Nitrospira sp.]